MCPIFIDIEALNIHLHRYEGFYYFIAYIVGYLVMLHYIKRDGFMKSITLQIFMAYLVVFATIGARLFHFLFWEPGVFFKDPLVFFRFGRGGASETGGILIGFIGAIVFAKRYKVNLLRFSDYIALGTPVGIAVGRIGCFLNGDSYGFPTDMPWGVVFHPKSVAYERFGALPLHPTQLYETLLMLIVFAIILYMYKRDILRGRLFFLFFVLYGIARFVLEIYRGDRVVMFHTPFNFLCVDSKTSNTLSSGQFLSLVFIVLGIAIIYIITKIKSKANSRIKG